MKLYLPILLFLLYAVQSIAQSFETLRPENYPVGEALPTYSAQLRLAEGQTQNNTEVVVEYPEYKKLTNKEIKVLKKAGIHLSERLDIQTTFCIERKQNIVEVNFAPFLIKDGNWVRLTSVRISARPKTNIYSEIPQTTQQRYTENSILSSGKWVKIAVLAA